MELVGKNTDSGMFGKGFYFTDDYKYASSYNRSNNGKVLEVYLKISNPLIINKKSDIPLINVPEDTIEDLYNSPNVYSHMFRDYLIVHGYDGVIDNISQIKQYVVLYPNQIKSIDNDGSFDINSDNIYS